MTELEPVHDAGYRGENAGGRVAFQGGYHEHTKPLREDDEYCQRGKREGLLEEGGKIIEREQAEAGKRCGANPISEGGDEKLPNEEIQTKGPQICCKPGREELNESIEKAEDPDQVHAFEGSEGGVGDGRQGKGKKGKRIKEKWGIGYEEEGGEDPDRGDCELKRERLCNETCGFACAGNLANEVRIGAEVGDGVGDEDDRSDEGKLTKRVDVEPAGEEGDEQERQSLRREAGEEEVNGVATEGIHFKSKRWLRSP
jgi:hypothetical protein